MSVVVRSGDTVKRTATLASKTIQQFLAHLRNAGVDWVPEPLGFDASGKEILSFISGQTVDGVAPTWFWDERILFDIAKRLRHFHDASASFQADGPWNYEPMEPAEVILHRDFAPYNCVFRDERFVGLIDFDLCGPGPRLWDIAYTAYRFVPLMPFGSGDLESPFSVDVMNRRLETFLDAYDYGYTPTEVLAMTVKRLDAMALWIQDWIKLHPNSNLARNLVTYTNHRNWLAGLCGHEAARPHASQSP